MIQRDYLSVRVVADGELIYHKQEQHLSLLKLK